MLTISKTLSFALVLASFGFGTEAVSQTAFEKDIRPIFEAKCAACHFPTAEHLKAELDLSTIELALKGGKDGPDIIPGKASDSPLVQMIEGTTEPRMPPKKFKALDPKEIQLIKQWINEGAKSAGGKDQANAPTATKPEIEIAKAEDTRKNAFAEFLKSEAVPAQGKDAPAPSSVSSNSKFKSISSIAISPKGGLLARGGLHVVELLKLDPATGKTEPIAKLEGHADLVRGLAFSPDGQFLAAAGGKPARKGEIKIWRVEDHSLVRTIEGHADNIFDVVYSPDGKLLATCSYDRMVKLWNAESGEEVHNLKDHVDGVFALAFSPDGKILASASGDRTVKLWDVAAGKRILTLSDSLGPVLTVAFSPSGKQLAASGADKMIRIWDVGASGDNFSQSSLTGAKMLKSSFAHDAAVLKLIYSPDGKTIYTTSEDRRVKVWNAETLLENIAIEAQSDWVMALALSPDGKQLAAGRYDSTSTIYDAATGKILSGDDTTEVANANTPAEKKEEKKDEAKPGERKKIKNYDVENVIINGKVPASIQSISPRIVSRGTTVTLTVSGISLDEPELYITNPVIKLKLVSNEKLPIPEIKRAPGETGATIVDNAQPHKLSIEADVPADAPIGDYGFMLRTPSGVTNAMNIVIPPWADTPEGEPNNQLKRAAVIALPATITGSMNSAGDVDYYKVAAKKGQEIVFAMTDVKIQTPLLRLLDVEGKPLATSADFIGPDRQDPRLGYRFEADGEYGIEVSDKSFGMGNYRLNIGEFPYVAAVFPLGVRAGPPQKIHVKGFNIGSVTEMEIDPPDSAKPGQTMALPIPGYVGNPIPAAQIAIGQAAELIETEPNDTVDKAQAVSFPSAINARMQAADKNGKDEDLYKFFAKKDQKILIEVMAARLDSPLDSVIDILDAKGNPLELATVRCVAQTIQSLSDRDSSSAGIRIADWTGMQISDYVMLGSEIIRVKSLPGYADEDVQFSAWPGGQRRGYFGTTPEHHAVNTPIYKVEIHPPGAQFPPNGLPTFHLFWHNDDVVFEGKPSGDSFLEFVAPSDGDFIVRVRDTDDNSGEKYVYRLVLREPQPDFEFFAGPYWPNVPAGGSATLDVRVRRNDGYHEPVEIIAEGIPEGYTVDSGVVLPDEENLNLALRAAPDAKSTPLDAHFKLKARAMVNGAEVIREAGFGAITIKTNPDIKVRTDVASLALEPGGKADIQVDLDRANGFTGRVPLSVMNLPFGVRVMNTGLNGILVRDEETTRGIQLSAEPWVQPMERTIYVQARIETRSTSPVFIGPPIKLKIGGGERPQQSIASKTLTPEAFLQAIQR